METQAIADRQVRNILVPTDFSACSEKALVYAINIARCHKSKLTFLHIVPPQFGMRQRQRSKESLRAAWHEMKRLQFNLLSRGLLRDVPLQLLVKRGKHWTVISKILKLQNTDLIVMGTHGRTGLKKVILGSFAETVFRRASCPVLTVGPSIPDGVVAEYPQRILFPTDDSHASKTAEPYAYRLGRAPGAQLTLLRVIRSGLFENGKSDGERLKHAKEHLQATGAYAAWRQDGATPSVVTETGHKVKTIVRVARAADANLVIVGIWGEQSDPEQFGWDDAYQLVCSAHCPVLTVRHLFPDPYFTRLLDMEPVRVGGASKKSA
jgi:nucleotide-binding universal stress UspA family protein